MGLLCRTRIVRINADKNNFIIAKKMIHEALTDKIIKAFYKVYNTLGYGFLEKVYENALIIELENNGLNVEAQKPISVLYENRVVGDYFADLCIDDTVIIEL